MSGNFGLREAGQAVGIENCGNTCFMNSLLQFYFMIPPLIKKVFEVETTGSDPHSVFLNNLQNLYTQLMGTVKKSVNPRPLLNSLEKVMGNHLKFGSQEDIGEFHEIFIETLLESFKRSGQVDLAGFGKLFTGENTELIVYNEDLTPANKINSKFQSILIANQVENLEAQWLESIFADISGLLRGSSARVDAKQEIWINQVPDILFFQIKRVFHISGTDEMYKDSSGIKVPKELYVDRMMLENREITIKLRKECQELTEKKKQIMESLHNLKQDNKNNLIDSIKTVKNFIASDLGSQFNHSDNQGIKYLEAIEKYVSEQIHNYEKEIEEIEKTIDSKFESMKNNQFILHSVLVHDGISGSGHYFAIIRDLDLTYWRMYNDSNVRIIEESEVFDIIQGKKEGRAAYCVIYINPKTVLANMTDFPFLVYNPSLFEEEDYSCEYQLYIQSNRHISELIANNANSVEDQKLINYQDLFTAVKNNFDSAHKIFYQDTKSNFQEIQSLSSYLNSIKKNELIQFSLIDYACKITTSKNIQELDELIRNALLKYFNFRDFSNNLLIEYKFNIEKFKAILRTYKLSVLVLDMIIEQKFNAAARVYCCYIHQSENTNPSISELFLWVFKSVLCNLISDLIKTSKMKNLQGCIETYLSIYLLLSIYRDYSFINGFEDVIISIEKRYSSNFKSDKNVFNYHINLIKVKDFDISYVLDKAFDDLLEFNVKFEQIDMISYKDNSTTFHKINECKNKIMILDKYWKLITERKVSTKKIEMKDFETSSSNYK